MKKPILIVLILLLMAAPLMAQFVNRVVTTQGEENEFPDEGYYAASNNFPRNSLVELRDPASGKSIQVIVTKRLNTPGNFIVLSDEASRFLGVSRDNPISLFASTISIPGLIGVESALDLPYSVDPEINPRAEFTDPNVDIFSSDAQIRESVQDLPIVEPTPEPPPSSIFEPPPEIVPAVTVVPEIVEPPAIEETPAIEEPPSAVARGIDEALNRESGTADSPTQASDEEKSGIFSALSQLQRSSNPITPPFDILKTDHIFWPEEFSEEPPEPPVEPVELVEPVEEPEPPVELVEEPEPPIEPVALIEEPEPPVEEPLASTPDYAETLDRDPVAEWIARAQQRYPDRDLFLPSSEEVVELVEIPEALDLSSTVVEDTDEAVSDIGSDFTDLPKADLLAIFRPEAERPLEERPLPIPESSYEEEAIELSNIRTDAPPLREADFTGIPLAQYIDPVPTSEETPIEEKTETPLPKPEFPEPGEIIVELEEAEFRSPVAETPEPEPEPEPETDEAPEPEEVELVDNTNLLRSLEENIAENIVTEEEVPAPPVEQPEPTPAPAPVQTVSLPDSRWAEENLPLVRTLQTNGYYLQVGAFVNPRSAKRLLEDVSPGYPLAVLPIDKNDQKLYRVFVGPLTDDEKGTVLYWFKARGYRNAFLRKGS